MIIKLMLDFGGVIEGLAVADAYASARSNLPYWDAIIGISFDQANTLFNNKIAAYAEAGGPVKHMFEWGTTGVNRGATNVRPYATEERARLWLTTLLQKGAKGGASVMFEYKPSQADVPISTSVPQVIRSQMRRHQFEWKARVMELNQPVTIEPTEAQMLLIPYAEGALGFKNYDIKRGYRMARGPITTYPGLHSHGNFTTYWERYWLSQGPKTMEAELAKELDIDFIPLQKVPGKVNTHPVDILAAVKARSKTLQAQVAAKAKARRRVVNVNY